jgi:hypothetical protein
MDNVTHLLAPKIRRWISPTPMNHQSTFRLSLFESRVTVYRVIIMGFLSFSSSDFKSNFKICFVSVNFSKMLVIVKISLSEWGKQFAICNCHSRKSSTIKTMIPHRSEITNDCLVCQPQHCFENPSPVVQSPSKGFQARIYVEKSLTIISVSPLFSTLSIKIEQQNRRSERWICADTYSNPETDEKNALHSQADHFHIQKWSDALLHHSAP